MAEGSERSPGPSLNNLPQPEASWRKRRWQQRKLRRSGQAGAESWVPKAKMPLEGGCGQ